ncbi:transcription factor DIVARICATA-like [Ananas comosus]|uniref:Transcription factor MYBS1 n=1 Tax=Ananas comosus TaxID=4615 RepID=A0A6P5GYL1_ANACO|nr:transcription factor DIVARICATA-like [Ananas comosus]
MMKESWMEVLPPTPPHLASRFLSQSRGGGGGGGGAWTQEENKAFEEALARLDRDDPDRWARVAAAIPGKTEGDVIAHYRQLESDVSFIEAGLVPFPRYAHGPSSAFTLDWDDDACCRLDGLTDAYCVAAKRSAGRGPDQERKKGVPWTEKEHKLFLMGLKKYGRGDWRNISRNFVTSRTSTQVASHAQKYFIRLNSGGKDKRRSSIHDITTVNLPDDDRPPSPSQPPVVTTMSSSPAPSSTAISDQISMIVDSKRHNEAATSVLNSSVHSNPFVPSTTFGIDPYGLKLESQDLPRGILNDSFVGW